MSSAGPLSTGLAGEVAEVVARYRLALGPQRLRGRQGTRAGRGAGSSLEFFDFRDYAPGDDLRHLDWRGFARTEQLRVRLHQEEVAPFVDVLVDTSASLGATPTKERAARALVAALAGWARREGATVRVLALGGGPVDPADMAFDTPATVPAVPSVPLRPGAVRVLVTDGLWPDDPQPLLSRLLAGAARFACLQLLTSDELSPPPVSAVTLVDCETGERREVQLDAPAIAGYRARLDRLCDALRAAVVGRGGLWARVTADALPAMCRHDLLPAGLLEPA